MTVVTPPFESLVEQHQGILRKVAWGYCREPQDREDLVQEIVLQLWRSFGRYDPRLRFSTWMYRIAMNVAISHYRARRNVAAQSVPLEEASGRPVPDDGASDETRLLYELIRELDELNRALVLLYLDGYSHAEIGEVLGLTPTNVATKVNRLKDQLRTRYEERNR